MKRFGQVILIVVLLGSGPMWAGSASAEMITFKAQLSAADEVPPNDSTATGEAEATLDTATKTLQWTVTYSGLSGPAIGAHFHGPSEPGKNAGIAIPFPVASSPIKGAAVLSDAQVADVMGGKWYANIHTARNPGGEIRGQLTPVR
jgi:hypothetical protein